MHRPVTPPHSAFQAFKGANCQPSNVSKPFPKLLAASTSQSSHRTLLLRGSKVPIASPQNSPNASRSLLEASTSQSSHGTLLLRRSTSKLSKRFPNHFGSFHKPVKPRHSLRRSRLPIARPQSSPNASLSLSAVCTGQSSHRTLPFRHSKVAVASPQTSPNHSPSLWKLPQPVKPPHSAFTAFKGANC